MAGSAGGMVGEERIRKKCLCIEEVFSHRYTFRHFVQSRSMTERALAKPIRDSNLENYPARPNIFKTGFPQGFKVCLGIFFLNKVE